MTEQSKSPDTKSETLNSADYDRLYEYRLAPRHQDLRKVYKRQRRVKTKGPCSRKDPTARKALNRVMYSTKSDGF